MSEGKIYVGQIGALLEVNTQGLEADSPEVDWSSSTSTTIKCRLPDKSEVDFPATLDGALLKFITTTADELPLAGTYSIQAHVVGPGYDALGETAKFRVYDKWK